MFKGKISITSLVFSSLLVAISIVCGKYLAVNVGPVLRFSFENLPILLAGIFFGPLLGALVGVVADLIGCVLVGFAVNPMVTIGAASIGAIGGAVYMLMKRSPMALKTVISVFVAHIIGSVVIKTVGLASFYQFPFMVLMAYRALNYLIVGAVESLLLILILKHKGIRNLLKNGDKL